MKAKWGHSHFDGIRDCLSPLVAMKTKTIHRIIYAFILFSVLPLTGCGKPVQQGQIFVATQGGENVKLGAIEILVFDEATINAFIKQRQGEIAKQLSKLNQDVGVAQAAFEKIDASYNKTVGEFQDVQQRYYNQETLIKSLTEKSQDIQRFRVLAARMTDLSNSIAQADGQIEQICKSAQEEASRVQDQSTRTIILSQTNQQVRTVLADKHNQQSNLDSLLPKYNELQKRVAQQSAEFDEAKAKLETIAAELKEKEKAEKDAENSHIDAEHELRDAKGTLAGFDGKSVLFKELPHAVVRTVSDADGRFRFELPSNGRFAVYAHGQRTVVQTEDYFWLVWSNGKDDLLLNNANMFGSKSSDQVVSNNFLAGQGAAK